MKTFIIWFLFTLRQRDLKKEDSRNIIVCVALTSRKWHQLSSLTEHSFLFMLIELRQDRSWINSLGAVFAWDFVLGVVLAVCTWQLLAFAFGDASTALTANLRVFVYFRRTSLNPVLCDKYMFINLDLCWQNSKMC